MKVLVYIPARGGSKGIPGKNLIDLNGHPLLYYTLKTAKSLIKSKNYKWSLLVSTDDNDIHNYCKNQGIEMDYVRPKNLSGDKSLIVDGVWDGLNYLNDKNISPEIVLLLQPTSPIRKTSDILNALERHSKRDHFSVASVTKMREHPYECIVKTKKEWSFLSKPKVRPLGRQEYEDNFYFIDGGFYISSVNFLEKYNDFIIEQETKFYIQDQHWAVDIDDFEDLKLASFLI